jgi:hypothetical protein
MTHLAMLRTQRKINQFLRNFPPSSSQRTPDMVTECEHDCLLRMAEACKRRGLTPAQAQHHIEAETAGFSTSFRIAQAVRRVFQPQTASALG